MESKTSFFNKTIFMKDIKRFWAIWGFELIVYVIAGMLPVYTSCNGIRHDNFIEDKLNMMRNVFSSDVMIMGNPIVMASLALIAAILVFSYINNTRDSYMIHSFPLKKETLFISHYMAGFVMVMLPYVIYSVIITGMSMGFGLGIARALVGVMFEGIIEFFLFYSLMCLVMMVSGNSIIAAVIYVVLNIIVVGVSTLCNLFSVLLVYGLSNNEIFSIRGIKFSPVIYFIRYFGLDCGGDYPMNEAYKNIGRFAVYIIPAILFIAAALYLYKKRPAETVGDMVSFKWCRPVFRTVFTLTGAPSATMLFLYIVGFNDSSIDNFSNNLPIVSIMIFLCSIVCYFISDMILNKTFFIWKKTSYIEMGVLTAVLLGFVFMINFGVAGMVIPKAEKVECIQITDGYGNTFTYDDQKDIKNVVDMQNDLVKRDRHIDIDNESVRYIRIEYWLKQTGERRDFSYCWVEGADQHNIDMFNKVFSDGKTVVQGLFTTSYRDVKFNGFNVVSYKDENEESFDFAEKPKERALIYNAIIEDIMNNNYPNCNNDMIVDIDMDITLYGNKKEEKKHGDIYLQEIEGKYINITIDKNYVNTIKVLKQLKILK